MKNVLNEVLVPTKAKKKAEMKKSKQKPVENKVRSLVLDIETMSSTVNVWGLYDQNIALNQIIRPGYVICWAAKWLGEEYTYFSSIKMMDRKSMLQNIWDMLDEADEVIGWNSDAFDLKLLNAEFLENGMTPPSPYKKIDLLRTVKNKMKFLSHKLDFVSQQIGIGKKVEHNGFPLWVGCAKMDSKSWKLMETYNIGDILLTEEMYYKVLPWITTGLNRSSIMGGHICPNCGSKKVQARGTYRTTTSINQRYQCTNCGAWSHGEKLDDRKPTLKLAK